MSGMSDEEVQRQMREAAIFAAPNRNEGMSAPCSEAIISGCVIVGWPGGPVGQSTVGGVMEYLLGRSVIAKQDDIDDLRAQIINTAENIDADPLRWGNLSKEWSTWFTTNYSRQAEKDEICDIFEALGYAS